MAYNFTHSPLKNKLHLLEIRKDAGLEEALRVNLSGWFWRDLAWRVKKGSEEEKRNANIVVKGEQGSGKSTVARVLKAFLDKQNGVESSIDDVIFTRKDFIERFKNCGGNDTIIIDEDFDFVTQIGSMRVREQLRFIEQAIRIEGINIVSCSVSHTPHLFNYSLRAFDIDYEQQTNRVVLYDRAYGTGWEEPVGFVLFDRRVLDRELERQYLVKKLAFTSKVKLGINRDVQSFLDKLAQELIRRTNFDFSTPKGVIKIACRRLYPDLSEVENVELIDTVYFFLKMAKYDKQLVNVGGMESFLNKKEVVESDVNGVQNGEKAACLAVESGRSEDSEVLEEFSRSEAGSCAQGEVSSEEKV